MRDVNVTEGSGRLVILRGKPPYITSDAGWSGSRQMSPRADLQLSTATPTYL